MQTIEQAIRTPSIRRALDAFHGVAYQPTAQTQQLRSALLGSLPVRSERDYTLEQIIERGLHVVRGHYASRDDLPQLPEPETMADVLRRQQQLLDEALRPGHRR